MQIFDISQSDLTTLELQFTNTLELQFTNTLFNINPLPHMLYLEHCMISINNSNFQIFSKFFFFISIVLKILWKM